MQQMPGMMKKLMGFCSLAISFSKDQTHFIAAKNADSGVCPLGAQLVMLLAAQAGVNKGTKDVQG